MAGGGVQLMFPAEKNDSFGVRVTYLTGKPGLSPSDCSIGVCPNVLYDEGQVVGFATSPDRITDWNITFFYRFGGGDSFESVQM